MLINSECGSHRAQIPPQKGHSQRDGPTSELRRAQAESRESLASLPNSSMKDGPGAFLLPLGVGRGPMTPIFATRVFILDCWGGGCQAGPDPGPGGLSHELTHSERKRAQTGLADGF